MSRPLRPCGQPGCPVLVEAGACPAHRVERKKDPEQARFYGSARWQRLRAIIRAEQPVCVECRAAPTKVVDHRDGDWTNNDPANLRGLCRACNDRVTGRQHQGKR